MVDPGVQIYICRTPSWNSFSERWMNKKKLRKAVKAAKNEHRYRQIEATRSPAEIYMLMRSMNPR